MIKNGTCRDRNRGIALLWVVLILVVLIGMLGLAVDTGYLMFSGHQLQNAADASVLAAMQKFSDPSAARTLAVDTAAAEWAAGAPVTLDRNDDNDINGDIVFIQYDRATGTYSTDTPWNAVKVTARRTSASPAGAVPLFFGPMFGVSKTPEERYAIAMLIGGTGAGLIVLDTGNTPHALTVEGSATLTVSGGAVQVNSSNSAGAYVKDNGSKIISPTLNVVGGADFKSASSFTGTLHTGVHSLADPLAGIAAPSSTGLPDKGTIDGKSNNPYPPGYYSGGINVGSNKNVTLQGGVYILGGPGKTGGISLGGTSSVTGSGVMLYVASGGVNTGSNTTMTLTPPTSGTYAHLTIFQAHGNATSDSLNGNGKLNLQGTLYFPSALLTVTGSGTGFGNQLVSLKLDVNGNGTKTINYTGDFPAAGGQNVALVK